ncbi:MAG: Rne/Rng family ribonuclease [Desulfovibrionaceae bacterium]
MKKKKAIQKMYISVLPGEQTEVVLTSDDTVSEYYIELLHQNKTKGNIYRGVVNNLDTNLQAAFINYGVEKNGFLQIDEIHPEYYRTPFTPSKGKKYPLLQKILKPGDEILVQVVKEPTPKKGAFLTTYPSLTGRFLILTPGREQIAISRKIEDDMERERLKVLLEGIMPGEHLGIIVRTVSSGTTKLALLRDLQFLKRLWKSTQNQVAISVAPSIVYQEPVLARRAVKDYLTEDIKEIWIDDEETAGLIKQDIALIFPRKSNIIRLLENTDTSLFSHSGLQQQIERIYAREVPLPSGGRLVFDQTEALMAIDINSGKITGKTSFEAMALRINLEAAQAIAVQLRLKDIGGQIVIDFIEMRDPKHWVEVEKMIKHCMKTDRARYDVGKISRFGLMEIVRQRTGLSAISTLSEVCPHCSGTGVRSNIEWQAASALREITQKLRNNLNEESCIYSTSEELGLHLLNKKRFQITALEEEYKMPIIITLIRDGNYN